MSGYKSGMKGADVVAMLPKMIEVTWQELKDLRDAGNLIAGMKYRMIDYDTYTSQEGTESAMHPFDLILTALDNKTLSEECDAIQSARDTDGYYADVNLNAWKVWYCLDNDKSRFAWAAVKGVISSIEGVNYVLAYYGDFEWEGSTHKAYVIDGTMLFGVPAQIYVIYATENPSIGEVPILVVLDGTKFGEGWVDMTNELAPAIVVTRIDEITGKGVIYRLYDKSRNIDIYYDFTNIKFDNTSGDYYYTIGTSAEKDLSRQVYGVKITKDESILKLGYYRLDPRNFDSGGISNITIKNCAKVDLYTQEGSMTNLYFENCSIDTSAGNNVFFRYIQNSSFKNVSGTLLFEASSSKYNNIDADGALPSAGIYEGDRKTYIRKHSNGAVFTYTEDDIYHAINK